MPSIALRNSLTTAQVAQYHRDGYIVVPNLLDEKEVERFLANEKNPPDRSAGKYLRVHTVDPVWESVAKHPNVAGIAKQLLDGTPMIVQTMYLPKGPGGTGIALHQDTHYIKNDPNTLMACWIAFTDTDQENGGFTVVPGTHTGPLMTVRKNTDTSEHDAWEETYTLRDRDGKTSQQHMYRFKIDVPDEKIVKLAIPRGAGIFFHGMLIHGSFGNHSKDRDRLAWAVHYVREGTWVFREDIQNLVKAL